MKYFFLILLISCSTTEISQERRQKISVDMGLSSQRLLGHFYRKVYKRDVTPLNKDVYLMTLFETALPSEQDYINFLKDSSPEVAVQGLKEEMKVCVKLKKPLFILCDKGSTAMVDFYEDTKDIEINSFIQSF